MAQESVTKEISGKIVIFSGIDSLLKEKFERVIDEKVGRGVPLEQIREDMAKFGWTSRIDDPYLVGIMNHESEQVFMEQPEYPGQPAWPLKEREIKKESSKRGRKASPKMELALKYYAEHSAKGFDESHMLANIQKDLDVTYANAYNWLLKFKKLSGRN